MASYSPLKDSAASTSTSACSVVAPVILLTTATSRLPLLPRLRAAPLKPRKRKRKPPQIQKKAKQSSGLSTCRGLHWPSLCNFWGSKAQHVRSFHPNSLCVPLVSLLIFDSSLSFSALVNSGSTHCFIDPKLVQTHNLLTTAIKPIELILFDRTSNAIITQSVDLPVKFPTDESITFNFYVTPLDASCSMVLGYNWLTHYNPMIDWVLGRIIFHPQLLDQLIPTLTSTARAASLPSQKASVSEETPEPSVSILSISIIGADTLADVWKGESVAQKTSSRGSRLT